MDVQAVPRLLRELDAAGHHRQGLRHRPVRRRGGLHGRLHPDASSPRWRRTASWTTRIVVAQRRPRRDALRPRVLLRPPRPVRRHAARAADHPLPGQSAGGQARAPATTSTRTWCRRCWNWPASKPRHRLRRPQPAADGRAARVASHESEFYITECTWMRKHGWRTPQWKLIVALEPDFHFKPAVELYNLVEDPDENNNLAESEPDVVAAAAGADGCVDREAREGDRAARTRCYTRATGTATRASAPSPPRSRRTTPCTSATRTRPPGCRPSSGSKQTRRSTMPLRVAIVGMGGIGNTHAGGLSEAPGL